MDVRKETLKLHKENKGKIGTLSKVKLKTNDDLTLAYTPGVADVCREIFKNPETVWDYTIKQNTVGIVTDGSAVLGLGDIGPEASMPVMEGKALILKEFADVDAFPICLDTNDEKEIIDIVKKISPTFGAINLEDIKAPGCFHIEDALQDIGIPVFHDDQHGTAIVMLAALINAAKVVDKRPEDMKIVISGAGAAGTAVTKLLLCMGYDKKTCVPVKEILLVDSKGIIYDGRGKENHHKDELAKVTNKKKRQGTLEDALVDADVFIGVSRGGLLKKEMIKKMARDPIVFAMANPIPEIMPDEAKKGGAKIVATGRSDFPNQVNNALGFPGVFKGALDVRASKITNEMKLAAVHALANIVKNPTEEHILPSIYDKNVVKDIANAVSNAAIESGVARK